MATRSLPVMKNNRFHFIDEDGDIIGECSIYFF